MINAVAVRFGHLSTVSIDSFWTGAKQHNSQRAPVAPPDAECGLLEPSVPHKQDGGVGDAI
jgi:hypothetical protein